MARTQSRWILSGLVLLVGYSVAIQTQERPNIVVILADDLGWNDVSFHGSDQIQTPNIDALAYNGVILNNHYVSALCTPSRAALLTGKYPTHTGMQHLVILAPEPWGLPLSHRLMPEYLRDAGYATHAIGKWHLGFFKSEYTPTYRGFDSHFGYWNGYQDYFDHSMRATLVPYKGYDMRRNMSVDWQAAGRYSTDLFTEEAVHIINTHNTNCGPLFLYLSHLAPHAANDNEPFQAPDEDIARFGHIEDPERRVYAAMVSKLDQSVGEVMAALRSKGMLQNSIVLFMSDNGAPTYGVHSNRGSNWPLRGMKESPWEGGIRGVAALWSPLLNNTQRVSKQMLHISDWLPTLYSAAGLNVKDLGEIDGIDMWNTLSGNLPSLRTEIVHNIDDVEGYAAVRSGDWKYITGTTQNGEYDEWYGESGQEEYSLNPKYDMTSVMRSKAATAIAGMITKLQLKEKEIKMTTAENDSSQNPGNPRKSNARQYQGRYKLLTEKVALSLREDSEIHCSDMSIGSLIDGNGTTHYTECHPQLAPCLFNIREDPCETLNLASVRPLILHSLEETLERYKLTTLTPLNVPGDPKANPILWNATWTTWQDDIREDRKSIPFSAYVVVALLMIGAVILLGIMVKMFLTRMPEKCSLFSAFLIKESKESFKQNIDVRMDKCVDGH